MALSVSLCCSASFLLWPCSVMRIKGCCWRLCSAGCRTFLLLTLVTGMLNEAVVSVGQDEVSVVVSSSWQDRPKQPLCVRQSCLLGLWGQLRMCKVVPNLLHSTSGSFSVLFSLPLFSVFTCYSFYPFLPAVLHGAFVSFVFFFNFCAGCFFKKKSSFFCLFSLSCFLSLHLLEPMLVYTRRFLQNNSCGPGWATAEAYGTMLGVKNWDWGWRWFSNRKLGAIITSLVCVVLIHINTRFKFIFELTIYFNTQYAGSWAFDIPCIFVFAFMP